VGRRSSPRFNRGRIATAGGGLAVVDFAQQLQVDSAPSALGVVDFAQQWTVAGTPTAAPTVTPLTVYGADLHQWHRGDIVTLATGVSSWTDLSGKGNHSVQADTTKQPAYSASDATLGGRPTVTGDGVNDVLAAAALTTNLVTDDFYIAFIFKPIAWVLGGAISGGAGTGQPRLVQNSSTPIMQMSASTANVNTNSAATIGTWVRGECFWSATAGVSYLKLGATEVKTGNPGPTGSRTSSLIFQSTGACINAAMAEWFVVKRAAGSGGPTGPERAAINAAWSARYPSAVF
jgi:hypothetical protein